MAKHRTPRRIVRLELEIDPLLLRKVGKGFVTLGYLIGVAGGLIEIVNKLGGH
jgi:hypothetical protein